MEFQEIQSEGWRGGKYKSVSDVCVGGEGKDVGGWMEPGKRGSSRKPGSGCDAICCALEPSGGRWASSTGDQWPRASSPGVQLAQVPDVLSPSWPLGEEAPVPQRTAFQVLWDRQALGDRNTLQETVSSLPYPFPFPPVPSRLSPDTITWLTRGRRGV